MSIGASALKWALRFYPPMFLQRVWVQDIAKDFRSASVKLNKSLLNRNYNNSIFGGTIFAAADPFYPVLFYQIFTKKGYKVIVWSKSAEIQFIKPGATDLFFAINISETDIADAEQLLLNEGKFVKPFLIEVFNTSGELCVTVSIEVYIRDLNFINATT
ncbi:DUF4442 domain-containing protein [Mucilaginibacter sp. RS28]|uniref:DUF4442 domain-containing protein n=1 Tax=Mucilaginibacter straminoryzae TaxID=2932774 RepID=A0A9X1X2Z2_9SPHI|nr:DUF4442 domain-containing protein [Mucilaginibacter straminoryzae]MCJ8209676.1 DUF4442 domain-containing protein [Mucilaginibacter straminoryzae]